MPPLHDVQGDSVDVDAWATRHDGKIKRNEDAANVIGNLIEPDPFNPVIGQLSSSFDELLGQSSLRWLAVSTEGDL